DRFSDAKATARAKGFRLHCGIGELSGAPFCTASGKYRGAEFDYTFHDDEGHVDYSEAIWYDAGGFRFLAKGDPRVRGLIDAVFNDAVAQDFLQAKAVATAGEYQLPKSHITFLRGRKYGYATGEGGGFTMTLYRLNDLNREIANAKRCATMECGD
ncbi:MAG: hypothetical protein M3M96_00160, partial [Candidatus Eremiobacteraeota bacterium]|nr:hypothetical protein [Candidatus Eremiobacteraeota bacterium]